MVASCGVSLVMIRSWRDEKSRGYIPVTCRI